MLAFGEELENLKGMMLEMKWISDKSAKFDRDYNFLGLVINASVGRLENFRVVELYFVRVLS